MTDTNRVRAILASDRAWSAYALGDLVPRRAPYARWRRAEGDRGLTLVYHEFSTPVLFAIGPIDTVSPLLAEVVARHARLYLHVDVPTADWLRGSYAIQHEQLMWRMVWDPNQVAADEQPTQAIAPRITRLGTTDLPALETLFADGIATGEAPDFFYPQMVDTGPFFGIWREGALVAAAGSHLCEPDEGVAAIGNVYTRRDQRGHGWATLLMQTLLHEMRKQRVATVVLNVKQSNVAAERIYARLGFRRHLAFVEGLAVR